METTERGKQISSGRPERIVRNEPNFRRQRDGRAPRDQECETNPIGGVSSVKFEVTSGEPAPQTHHIPQRSTIPTRLGPSERRNVRNEPNLGRERDRTCETNPIRTRGKGSVGQTRPYRWTPLRQTNPIRPGQASIEAKCAKRTQFPGPERLAARAKRAKQSQFGAHGMEAKCLIGNKL
jgi:hypothetical protein